MKNSFSVDRRGSLIETDNEKVSPLHYHRVQPVCSDTAGSESSSQGPGQPRARAEPAGKLSRKRTATSKQAIRDSTLRSSTELKSHGPARDRRAQLALPPLTSVLKPPSTQLLPTATESRASLGELAAESPTQRQRHFRWGGAGRGGGRRSSGRSSVWVPGAAADADGGRRVAAAAPVTARVPVSGRGPAGGGWRPRPGALAPVVPGVAGRAAGCCGWSRPAPARGPARPPGSSARLRAGSRTGCSRAVSPLET